MNLTEWLLFIIVFVFVARAIFLYIDRFKWKKIMQKRSDQFQKQLLLSIAGSVAIVFLDKYLQRKAKEKKDAHGDNWGDY